ncbi:MAG TPA: outer membrane beta-barrel protein [Steroidobacteraceae bacterium]|nr:outer membrane beta-barrel protein [Steroidobacteraceae bacterium]
MVAGVALALSVAPAAAADKAFELTPFVGAVAGGQFDSPEDGGDLDVESSASYGVTLDLGAGGFDRQYQLYYSQQQTELDTGTDVDIEYLHIGGILAFPEERFVPYVVGTLGATRFSADGADYDDETRFSLALGGGLKFPLAQHLALRLEARAFVTLVDSESEFLCVSQGGAATCLVRGSGSTFIQFQALAGVTFRF